MEKHNDVVSDLEHLRKEHKGKDGVWLANRVVSPREF